MYLLLYCLIRMYTCECGRCVCVWSPTYDREDDGWTNAFNFWMVNKWWMDGWTNVMIGWMTDGWMDECNDRMNDGWLDGWNDGWVGGWNDWMNDGWVDEWREGWNEGVDDTRMMDEWIEGLMTLRMNCYEDRQMGRQMKEQSEKVNHCERKKYYSYSNSFWKNDLLKIMK